MYDFDAKENPSEPMTEEWQEETDQEAYQANIAVWVVLQEELDRVDLALVAQTDDEAPF